MDINANILADILTHAWEDAPFECCGLIATKDNEATSMHRSINISDKPEVEFIIDPLELIEQITEFESQGFKLGAIYHSHICIPAFPSMVDVQFAENWPDVEWLIVGVGPWQKPVVRSYLINDEDIRSVDINVTGGIT